MDAGPWTIRGVPPEQRQAATADAARRNTSLGQWMGEAIDHRIRSDRASDSGLTGEIVPRVSDIPSDGSDRVSDMAEAEALAGILARLEGLDRCNGARADARRALRWRLKRLGPPPGPEPQQPLLEHELTAMLPAAPGKEGA